ncbi:MAG: DEAD/DEAH box helicase [Nitrospinae bacterium]|nr:DEAD/DEAH box helicase [Nitrospinota bacterium]MBI3815647.1 DEAD/DEAH box helicase [Nitrospinota bacterium]
MEEKEIIKFDDFNLSRELNSAVSAMGFEEPTPIQSKTIPILLSGRDVIGQAQTGTGKTAAYGIPIVEKAEPENLLVHAIILTPTRELAIQVAEEMNKIGRFKRIFAVPIYGGQSIDRQIRLLRKGVHVVVGTPGRVIDHIRRKTLRLESVKMVVLDEADEMLDMGFIDDIGTILKQTPKERQTLLFSATMPKEILKIASRYMQNPEKVMISKDALTVPMINQIFYEVRPSEKMDALCRLIDAEDSDLFLIFCHTKREVDDVASDLKLRGYDAEAIHGDFSQFQREAVMKKFREGRIDVLVATDVAARGLDISNITHVVNYSIPQNPESYVHRIGRTGRAGKEGVAITFVTPREDRQLRLIQTVAKTKIKRGKLPTLDDVMGARIENIKERIQEFVDDKRLDAFVKMAERLSEGLTPIEVAASLLKFQLEGFGAEAEKRGDLSIEDTGASPGMVRLFITIGRQQKIRPGDIVRHIAEKAGIDGKAIGNIKILEKFTFVEVPKDMAEKVIDAVHKGMMAGKKISAAPARPRNP